MSATILKRLIVRAKVQLGKPTYRGRPGGQVLAALEEEAETAYRARKLTLRELTQFLQTARGLLKDAVWNAGRPARKKRSAARHRVIFDDEILAVIDLDPGGLQRCLEEHTRWVVGRARQYEAAGRRDHLRRARSAPAFSSWCKWGFGSQRILMTTALGRRTTHVRFD